jgi:type IV pilus assembly protein PilB
MAEILDTNTRQRVLEILRSQGYEVPGEVFSMQAVRAQVPSHVLARALAEATGHPFVDLSTAPPPEAEALRLAPRGLLEQGVVLPYRLLPSGMVEVLVGDPTDLMVLNAVRTTLKRAVSVAVADPALIRSACLRAMEELYGGQDLLADSIGQGEVQEVPAEQGGAALTLNRLVEEALLKGATDIHLERLSRKEARVRYRIDGQLVVADPEIGAEKLQGVINALKIRASLDPADRLHPQGGRFLYVSPDGKIRNEIRVSIIPTVLGEEAVLRILPKENAVPRLENLGFSVGVLERLRQVAATPHGLFLVSGPTGSGKTTTLFALVQEILETRSPKILSVEDPVEYRLKGVSQVQVNLAEGVMLTFAVALREFLRQDPDVILVGEIRDPDSAKIAVEAAMTGHLVLGTIHTNSSAQVAIRLGEMGVEPFRVADALKGALAQRLVPRLCPRCRVEDPETGEVLRERYRFGGALRAYTKGGGCEVCNGTGYKGRVGIHELFWVSPAIRQSILRGRGSEDLIAQARREQGFKTLFEDGLEKVAQGIISFHDLLVATGEVGA